MRHGFEVQAERRAGAARQVLGVLLNSPIDPSAYAAHLNVRILDFAKLGLSPRNVSQLTIVDGDCWSAMTLHFDGTISIALNPAHAITRQRNDLMRELAHVELRHTPMRVEVSGTGLLLLGDYSDEQEQEADWLASALLLPREGLVQLHTAGRSIAEIAHHYGVSEALCAWRLRVTGVDIKKGRAYANRVTDYPIG
ncbi:MAG TPA: ImmA/IrrE family metallo-endopeptidase [Terracidiphilus sp.]|jgi:hypothetical protein